MIVELQQFDKKLLEYLSVHNAFVKEFLVETLEEIDWCLVL